MEHSEKIIKPKIKILSIDGGGIKGIIPCVILKYIREQLGVPLTSVFDLFAGTSTGGIIVLGLTKPKKETLYNELEPEDMLNLYVKHGKEIFNHRLEQKTKTFKEKVIGIFNKELVQESFDTKNLELLLKVKFGETKLSDCLSNVLVTSFDIQKNQTVYFLSRTAKGDHDQLCRNVARYTSAAPTYFKPVRMELGVGEQLGLIDGGVFANNPSILAYCEAKELWKRSDENKTLNSKMQDLPIEAYDDDFPFFMLSIGTGQTKRSISVEEAENFSTMDWAPHLLKSIFMDSVAENTHFTMQHLLPPYKHGQQRYWRIEIEELPIENSDMCNTSDENINKLVDLAYNWINKKENNDSLNKIINVLKET